ncbi:AMP-binding protein [Kribbia dieselivorans]|uniref:AMP-binding protein n=1 Tax=Kribbia dieselivorans TaxID=331526 RepID=UPI000837FFDD|nr:AMP-binding protein [Kribbia dieselivorans]
MAFAKVTDRYSIEAIDEFYATGQWRSETLFDLLSGHAAATPDRVFLTDDHRSLTFGELRDQAIAFAGGLRARGIGAGDRVSVQVPNWVEFAVIAVALQRLGAIMVPIMPIYRDDDVAYIVDNAGVRLAITSQTFKKFDYAAMYGRIRETVSAIEDVVVVRGETPGQGFTAYADVVADGAGATDESLGEKFGPDEPVVIVYSSGTTSRPKGCLHTFNTLACGSRLLAKAWAITQDDVQFGPSPITHTTGLVTSIILPMMHGAASHVMESWVPEAGAQQIQEHRCTVAVTATTFLQTLLDAYDPQRHDLTSLRLWTCAGSPIPASIIERAAVELPTLKVLSLYGRTENVTTTMCTIDDPVERSLTSDGRVLPFQQVRIIDGSGHEVPRGEEGDIAYKGAMHMLEYINNPTETAALFTEDGFSRSGDLGTMDADGFVRVTGRTKDIVIRGGMNISVRHVEDLLSKHPAVSQVAAVGMPDERLGEKVCLYLVPTEQGTGLTLDDVRDYLLGEGLAIQKVPERLEIVEGLPMTATGKVQKHVLRSMIKERIAAEQNA